MTGPEHDPSPRPYDHFRVGADGPAPQGVYRVVGVRDGDSGDVTLLRVADGDGHRVNAGRVEHVAVGVLDAHFESAANPDAGFSPGSLLDPFRAMVSALRYYTGL